MTTIKNMRRGCVGVDLHPPIRPMRRRDEDSYVFLHGGDDLDIFSRNEKCKFFATLIACILLVLLVILVPLFLTGNGPM